VKFPDEGGGLWYENGITQDIEFSFITITVV